MIVERPGDEGAISRSAARSEDHFLVHRPPPGKPPDALERAWEDGRLHGIVISLEAAMRPDSQPLLQWAGSRGVLLYIEPDSWAVLEPVVGDLPSSGSPLLVVDPALSRHTEPQAEVEVPEDVVAAGIDSQPALHLVLAGPTAETAEGLCRRFPSRMLIGGLGVFGHEARDGQLIEEATENLRYLTERVTLMRLL